MTPPRQIVAGHTFEVTSRCISRMFLLAPSPEVLQTFMYVLGYYAQRHGITLYGLVLMSNHYHLLGLDKNGKLPDFMRDLNGFVGRILNAHYGRDDKFWSGDGYHLVRPINAEDLWARLMYVASNPINADLASRTEDYPGFVLTPEKVGKTMRFARPDFYRENGIMPDEVEVRFEVPETFGLTQKRYVSRFARELRKAEYDAKQRRGRQGRTVLGPETLRHVSPYDQPRSREKWFRTRGRIACKCPVSRKKAIAARKAFLEEYALAREEWREDVSGVEFPHGTWWVCRFAGASTRGAPA